MANIDSKDVKKLRDKTNAGMMDCKRALEQANGDLVEAESILRKKGINTAAKKAGREAREGAIAACIHEQGRVGVLVEINCETDFVAKNDSFKEFTARIASLLAADADADYEQLRVDAVASIGENILISRHQRFELGGSGLVASYIHLAGKVGVLVEVSCESDQVASSEVFRELVKDITLHIAASHPSHVSRDEVAESELAREREIYAAQVEGKPASIIDTIVGGKLDKYLSGICLLEQAFVKDPDKTVQTLLDEKSRELGETIAIQRFIRYQLGEETA